MHSFVSTLTVGKFPKLVFGQKAQVVFLFNYFFFGGGGVTTVSNAFYLLHVTIFFSHLLLLINSG
jgi:hypothetical protein